MSRYVLVLFIFCSLNGCKRKVVGEADALSRSVEFVSVNGATKFTFRSPEGTECEVILSGDTDSSRRCRKAEYGRDIYYANLGSLETDKIYGIHLKVWEKDKTEEDGSRHDFTYHPDKIEVDRDYRFKLNIPLHTAETFRSGAPSFQEQKTDFGCSLSDIEAKPGANSEKPFGISSLITLGFGEAKAQVHLRDNRYVSLSYQEFDREQKWNFIYRFEGQETWFSLAQPPVFSSLTIDAYRNIPLHAGLMDRGEEGKVRNQGGMRLEWQIANPLAHKMVLNVSLVSDDKGVLGECFADPDEGKMQVDEGFLRKLPVGAYTILIQLASIQRVIVAGQTNWAWQVTSYDWRQGAFKKL